MSDPYGDDLSAANPPMGRRSYRPQPERWDADPSPVGKAIPQLILERMRLGSSIRLSRYVAESLRVDSPGSWMIDQAADTLLVQLQAEILAHKVVGSHVTAVKPFNVPVPDGWWQMFKREYRGRWWMRPILRRWPIRMTMIVRYGHMTVDVSHYNRFPDADIEYPYRLGDPIPYTTVTPEMEVGQLNVDGRKTHADQLPAETLTEWPESREDPNPHA